MSVFFLPPLTLYNLKVNLGEAIILFHQG